MFTNSPHSDCYLAHAYQLAVCGSRALPVYDDGFDTLFVHGDEFGPLRVIAADTWGSAYQIAIDEMEPIAPCDVPEAYGCDTQADLDAAFERGEIPELAEGYQYQSCFTGTGIVWMGHHEWLTPLADYNARTAYPITPVFVPH